MNSVCAPSRTPASDAGGFSLVEVTMAMGIFIFGLVAILGLFPTALQTSRASLDLFTAAQLSRAVVADLERGEFSALSPSLQDEHFFNDRGKEIPESPDAALPGKGESGVHGERQSSAGEGYGNPERARILAPDVFLSALQQ